MGERQIAEPKIRVNANNHVYVMGGFDMRSSTDSVDFDPGPGEAMLISKGSLDIFLAKYDSAGNYIWAKSFGGTQQDRIFNFIIDDNGDIYAVGFFLSDSLSFSTDGSNVIRKIGQMDAYFAKFDTSGTCLWAKSLGGDGTVEAAASSIALRENTGEIYIVGDFIGAVDFNPGNDIAKLTGTGLRASFIAKYDNKGDYLWAGKFSGTAMSATSLVGLGGITITIDGGVYVGGNFSETADFDPGAGSRELTAAGGGILQTDIVVLKLIDGCPFFNTLSITECDSFRLKNTIYTQSGTYVDTFASYLGCDSIVTVQLTITHSTVNPVVSGEYCDSVTFNGQTYTATGVYMQQYYNFTGCDSSITYDVTIKGQTAYDTLIESVCGNFIFDDTEYINNGTYTVILSSEAGCDSMVTLNLTIKEAPDATIVKTGSTLTTSTGDLYQWLDCEDNVVIEGATEQSYTPEASGTYAAVVTHENGCSDTSECMLVEVESGIHEWYQNNRVHLYPNPANNTVYIETDEVLNNATIRLVNLLGQTLHEKRNLTGSLFSFNLAAYASGLYFVEVTEDMHRLRLKVIKE